MATAPQPSRWLSLLFLSLLLCSSLGHAGTINLAWDASPGATSYNLYYSTMDGPPYQTILGTGGATTASVSGLMDGTRYYFAATAINELGESGFSNEANAVPGVPTLIAVNVGGAQVTASDGTVYDADQWFTGGTAFTHTAAIAGTSDDLLYQSERYGEFTYNLPVQNGTYLVTLKFAEMFWNQRNKRIFDVLAEGQQVISNLDVYRQAGGKNRAYDQTVTVLVTDSVLTLQFRRDVDSAIVSAIKVVPQ